MQLMVLPDEVLFCCLRHLDMRDLCNVAQTCHRLRDLCQTRGILAEIGFGSFWPTPNTAVHYERAARAGNFEANIKLGVACLYGEGCAASPVIASEMLIRAEQLAGSADPFSWLLYRPPWSSDDCSKACIFRDMKTIASENAALHTKKYCGIMFCVAKTLSLQTGENSVSEAKAWFELSAIRGCGEAAFDIYKMMNSAGNLDMGSRQQSIRFLREHRYTASLNLQIALCMEYVKGNLAGASQYEAIEYFRSVVSKYRSAPSSLQCTQKDLDKAGKMRYILVDWLVEVADLKQFSRDTLYMTVGLVDRFLATQVVTRKTLQLLGIACMVIAARFSENEVITIREAAWLTDNTYMYEDVVRTMGRALCVSSGRLRVATHLDFLRLFICLTPVAVQDEELMHYVAELVLLHMNVANSSPVTVAAVVYFITCVAVKMSLESCWPMLLREWTGMSLPDLSQAITDIHRCCFCRENVKDHRGVELQAVNERYERKTGHNIKDRFTPPTADEIQAALQHCEDDIFCTEMDIDVPMTAQDSMDIDDAHSVHYIPEAQVVGTVVKHNDQSLSDRDTLRSTTTTPLNVPTAGICVHGH